MKKLPYEKINDFLIQLLKKDTIDIKVYHDKDITIIWNDGTKTVIKDVEAK